MALPDLIEIVPLGKPAPALITVPGSKSITNRALILAALASGATTLEGALWSEDTQVMVAALQALGFAVNAQPDPHELCNRLILVHGSGGRIPRGGTAAQPLELFVGNAGTTARFLATMLCLGDGVYRLHGVPRMHERPQAGLFRALRELGYTVESEKDRLPAVIHGGGPRRAACQVSIAESSQFASALLLCAQTGGWDIRIVGEDAEESPYVEMTVQLIKAFPRRGGQFRIEPDASSGSYFWAAGWLNPERVPESVEPGQAKITADSITPETERKLRAASPSCSVRDWPKSNWQMDARFPRCLPLPASLSRQRDLADSIMTAIILAPFEPRAIRFTDLGRLRVQECERVVALRTELTKCGAEILEQGDELRVSPSTLHGAEIETYNDHRIAMCFAILGLKVPGMKIKNPACVKKTFPDFFQKLAEPPPVGLGATILDAATGQPCTRDALFAE